MPTDGHSRGPSGSRGNSKPVPTRKMSGPGANLNDGGRAGAPGAHAAMRHGPPNDTTDRSPMKGPSMGGVLKYIKERGSGEKAAGDQMSGAMKGGEGEYESPYPTGGNPRETFDEGHDLPAESRQEMDADAESCAHCAGTGKKKKGGVPYNQSNHEMGEPKGR